MTNTLLPVGTRAPDFTLRRSLAQYTSLADFRGRPLVLAFYPADWSPVCGDQMALYSALRDEFHRLGAEGVIRWNYLSPDQVNPGADGILEALESLQTETAGKGGTQ